MDIDVIDTESARLITIDSFPSEGKDILATALIAYMKTSHTDLTTWHCCLGHLNADMVTLMLKKNMVTGMEIDMQQ